MGPLTTASGSLPTVATRTVTPDYPCLQLANLHLTEAVNAHDMTCSHCIQVSTALCFVQQRRPVPFQENFSFSSLFIQFDFDSILLNAM
jgi:hypothetical protein